MMDLKIINGTFVTSEKSHKADIGISKGKITAIASKIKSDARTIIDASGMLILPGVIDAHVHFKLRSGKFTTSENFESGTRAAACGGVTTIIDFAIQKKGQRLKDAVTACREQADGKVSIDYSLHAVPTDWNDKTRKELEKLADNGITTFKMYTVYPGLQVDDSAILAALKETAGFGGMITLHAESPFILDAIGDRYHNKAAMAKYGAYCLALSRPELVEVAAIRRAISYANAAKAKLYIVHTSTGRGAAMIGEAREHGVNVYGETCPHYLLFDDSIFKKRDGHLFATCPQVKSKMDSAALWENLSNGNISVVATDNCTFTKRQKDSWKGDYTKIPYGLPGVETLLPLMYTYGVCQKKLTINNLVSIVSTNPARLMGLYPEKGTIARGSDADLVIFDPKKKVTITRKNLETNCDWSPYEGFKLTGYPNITISRGQVVAIDGRFVGEAGWGKFLKRNLPADI